MDLRDNLCESKGEREKGGWKASLTSLVLHGVLVGGIIFIGATSTHRVNAEDKPIRAFVTTAAAPPPPPPPPPPPASASSSAPKATPHIETPKPVVHNTFIAPHDIPKDVPKVAQLTPQPSTDDKSSSDDLPQSSAPSTAVAGGVPGGVQGGVESGTVGGVIGGQVGGVVGGVIGGQVGGVVGGTGKDVNAEPKPEPAKPDPSAGPVRVGGDVKAPVVTDRVEPQYTEVARNAHVAGVVIVEAIIDKNGRVDQVKVLKGLPMGLSEEAERAVRQWRFKPGTMNGEPVDVIFDLTVNFKLN